MPPIPVYSSSPINAAKPSGVSPHTGRPDGSASGQERPERSEASHSATPSQNNLQHHAAAQPGARPSLPVQTGQPQPLATYGNVPAMTATPTQRHDDASPPAPQPGPVPLPPGASRQIPPPPVTSNPSEPGRPHEATTDRTAPPRMVPQMPPQMSYHPPSTSLPIQARSSTTPMVPPAPLPSLQQNYPPSDSYYSHPPGYQQNTYASELNAQQHVASETEPGVWDTAKKWASAAGESLAAAESQVWKRINKDN